MQAPLVGLLLAAVVWNGPDSLLERSVESMRLRREATYSKLAELQALTGLLQRLQITSGEIQEFGDAGSYIAPESEEHAKGIAVAPFLATRADMRIRIEKRPTDKEAVAEIRWKDWNGAPHRLVLRIDPLRQRAVFEVSNQVFCESAFRIVFPHRVQVCVRFRPKNTQIRVFNGPVAHQFEITPTSLRGGEIPCKLRPGEDLADRVTVLVLTDNTARFLLPGVEVDPRSATNEPDAHFLRSYTTWASQPEGLRDPEHRKLLEAHREFDKVDTETSTPNPVRELAATDQRTKRLDELNAATRRLQVQLTQVQIELLRTQLDEHQAIRCLRSRRQSRTLTRLGGYAEVLADAAAVAPPTEPAPAPRAASPVPTNDEE